MKEISIPQKLAPIVQAFSVESEQAIIDLIHQAAKAIYTTGDSYSRYDITDDEIESICYLIKELKPRDMIETLYAAQIVVSHMLGMHKISKNDTDDQRFGLKLLRFCNDSMQNFEKKKSGGVQNITVNYNYVGIDKPISLNHKKENENAN